MILKQTLEPTLLLCCRFKCGLWQRVLSPIVLFNMHTDLFCDIPLICIGLLYNYYLRFRFRICWYEPQIKLANVEPFNKERIGSSILESVSLTALLFIARDLAAGPRSLQSFPSLDGGGLVQVRWIVFVPLPHVTVHSAASSHSEKLPFTAGPGNRSLSVISTYFFTLKQ